MKILSPFFFLVCVYIYITYQIKKCVYNKKACVYVYVGGCFNKYISATTWPPQIKIPGSAPGQVENDKVTINIPLQYSDILRICRNFWNYLVSSYTMGTSLFFFFWETWERLIWVSFSIDSLIINIVSIYLYIIF